MKEKSNVLGFLGMIGGLAIGLIFLFGTSIFIGAGLLNILGFEYTSLKAVIVFFVLYTIIAICVEFIVDTFVLVITELGRFNKFSSNVIRFFFFVGFDIVILSALESSIPGIRVSDEIIILFSIITYTAGKLFEGASQGEDILKKRVKKGIGKKSKEEEEK